MSDDPLDREIERMAGDPRLVKAVRDSLERLRAGRAGPVMAEMARDLIEGRINLRDVGGSSVYSQGLIEGVQAYKKWESELDDEGRRQLRDAVRETYGRDLDEPS
ncbi:hypothetical protein [Actinoplanes sp. NPDC026670]|uniref:hypothetical protein n=1 Tax=Actinoplanes sp. NPDC026670 TaxID=3154700 RepID=UPI0033F59077